MSARDRTFQARDMLWTMFEQMAHEQAVPIDNLVNEAMKAYASARGYTAPPDRAHRRVDPLEETRDRPSASAMVDAYADDELGATQARRMDVRAMLNQPSHTPSGGGRPAPPPRMPAPAPSRPVRPAAGMPIMTPPPSRSMAEPTLRSRPPPLPPPGAPHTQRLPGMGSGRDMGRDMGRDLGRDIGGPSLSAKRLVLTYRGRPSTVDKDRFLIGRSKTQADLRLDDPNVSRQHVAIERVGSAWYVVDLGSTNGVFVSGERVNRRALVDGDVIVITTHEIRCSLQ